MSSRRQRPQPKYGRGASSGDVFSSHESVSTDKWQTAIVSCGSNAFGQLFQEGIMGPILKLTPMPMNEKGEPVKANQIAAGSTISATFLSGRGIAMWGAGLGTNFRVPTPIKVTEKHTVTQVSCGELHAGFVTDKGMVFTWGGGEHGALGHGNKQNQHAPKQVSALSSLICCSISCGPFHTAFIADRESEIGYIRIPPSAGTSSEFSEPSCLSCASLYTCGLGKAGQLGHGQSVPMIRTPKEVSWFGENGFRVAKVSCGMHHTLVIAVPVHATRMFITSVLSFGWGEHGRLGLGSEDGVMVPTAVEFPEPCHAIDISAGEQHSLATSGRVGGCFAWGSNSFGQCGVGSSVTTEHCLSPNKVPIPEGMRVVKVAAGGRHSAALSACGQVLLWGWGEEGQLGNGSEKNSTLPRPVHIPSVYGSDALPIDISLGMCHTMVLVKNPHFRPPSPAKEVTQVSEVEAVIEEEVKTAPIDLVESPEPIVIDPAPPIIPEPQSIERTLVHCDEPLKKEAVMVEEVEAPPVPTPVAIRSLKDILSTREERRECGNRDLTSVMESYTPLAPEADISPLKTCVDAVPLADDTAPRTEPEPQLVHEPFVESQKEMSDTPKRRGSGGNMQQAEIRKQKKSAVNSGASETKSVPRRQMKK